MGGMGYWQSVGKKNLLVSLFNGDNECIVRLVGTDKETGEPAIGMYKLYEKFDKDTIIKYATTISEESAIKVSKIEVLALKPLTIKEIQL